MKSIRPPFRETYFQIAWDLSTQATCPRKSVGCVIIHPDTGIVSGGYNDSIMGVRNCEQDGCIIEGGHCVRALHAEMRALASAASRGVSLHDCSVFCTLLPCINCFNALAEAGIRTIYYDESYDRDERLRLFELSAQSGVYILMRGDK